MSLQKSAGQIGDRIAKTVEMEDLAADLFRTEFGDEGRQPFVARQFRAEEFCRQSLRQVGSYGREQVSAVEGGAERFKKILPIGEMHDAPDLLFRQGHGE